MKDGWVAYWHSEVEPREWRGGMAMKSVLRKTAFLSALFLCATAYADDPVPEAISPVDAFHWASTDPYVFVLDVRTPEEYFWVGHPGPNGLVGSKNGKAKGLDYNEGAYLEGKVENIPSRFGAPPATPNNNFIGDVTNEFVNPGGYTYLVLCRSGGRAKAAATLLLKEGWSAYYITDGFRGPKNDDTQPGRDTNYRDVSGWVNDGLPWREGGDDGTYNP